MYDSLINLLSQYEIQMLWGFIDGDILQDGCSREVLFIRGSFQW